VRITAINRGTLLFSHFSVYFIKLYPLKELRIVDRGRVEWLCAVTIRMWKGQVVSAVRKYAYVGKPDLKTVVMRIINVIYKATVTYFLLHPYILHCNLFLTPSVYVLNALSLCS
jgi:hypothetical protein